MQAVWVQWMQEQLLQRQLPALPVCQAVLRVSDATARAMHAVSMHACSWRARRAEPRRACGLEGVESMHMLDDVIRPHTVVAD